METMSTVKDFKEPLKFFEQLTPAINSFESINSVLSYGYIFSDVKGVDGKKKKIKLEEPIMDILGNFVDTREVEFSLEDYAKSHIRNHAWWSIDTIKEYTHGVTEEVLKPYLQIHYNTIVSLINKYKESTKEGEKYPVFGEALLSIESEIRSKYFHFLSNTNVIREKVREVNRNNQTKITWLQGPTCLASFIFSLSQLETRPGSKDYMLTAKREQLIDLIINNFTDNGNEFSRATLDTYLDPKKKKKKTKYIELKFVE